MYENLLFNVSRTELEEVKQQMKKLSETKKEEKKRLADEDATRYLHSSSIPPSHIHTSHASDFYPNSLPPSSCNPLLRLNPKR